MGRSKGQSDDANTAIGNVLLFFVVPGVIGGVTYVIAHIGWWLLWLAVPFAVLVCVLILVHAVNKWKRQQRRIAEQKARREEEQRQIAAQKARREEEQRQIAAQKARREEQQQRKARRKEAEEHKRAVLARQEAERKARIDELGERGVKLVELAESAAKRVVATEAARTGWLGNPGELDFSADLTMIATSLKSARQLRQLTDELKAVPDHTADDRARLVEAKHKTEKLEKQAQERSKLLVDCAAQAERVDASLRDERKRARIAEQHDDLASRLDAMLYGVEATPDSPPSDAADKVITLVAAYHEIRGELERDRRGERSADGDENAVAANTSSWGVLAPVNRLWHKTFG